MRDLQRPPWGASWEAFRGREVVEFHRDSPNFRPPTFAKSRGSKTWLPGYFFGHGRDNASLCISISRYPPSSIHAPPPLLPSRPFLEIFRPSLPFRPLFLPLPFWFLRIGEAPPAARLCPLASAPLARSPAPARAMSQRMERVGICALKKKSDEGPNHMQLRVPHCGHPFRWSSLWGHEPRVGCAEMGRGRYANAATGAFGGAPYGATNRVRGVP